MRLAQSRMKLNYTRAMVTAALNGTFDNAEYQASMMYLQRGRIPQSCPDVPDENAGCPRTCGRIRLLMTHRPRSWPRCLQENFAKKYPNMPEAHCECRPERLKTDITQKKGCREAAFFIRSQKKIIKE